MASVFDILLQDLISIMKQITTTDSKSQNNMI